MYGIGKYMAENKFFFALGSRAWFITLIITGVIFALVKNREISKKEGIIFLSINYILTIVGMYLYSPGYIQGEKYLVSFVYAILVFVAFSKIELKENIIVSFISKISFAVYLTHMTFGGLTISLFEQKFPNFPFAVVVSIGTFLAAIILHYSVEVPLKKMIAKI